MACRTDTGPEGSGNFQISLFTLYEKPGLSPAFFCIPIMMTTTITTQKIPARVLSDDKKRQLWSEASEDTRFMAAAMCAMRVQLESDRVRSYLAFAEQVRKKFYLKDDYFGYGKRIVRKAASIAGISRSLCYAILNVARWYSLADYQALVTKAAVREGGVSPRWNHLRILAERLGDYAYDQIRKRIELKLIRKYYTDEQLHALIDEECPETRRGIGGRVASSYQSRVDTVLDCDGTADTMLDEFLRLQETACPDLTEQTPEESLRELREIFARCSHKFENWSSSFTRLAREIEEKDQATIRPVIASVYNTLHSLENMSQFVVNAQNTLSAVQRRAWQIRNNES